jgi:hypothetical protein
VKNRIDKEPFTEENENQLEGFSFSIGILIEQVLAQITTRIAEQRKSSKLVEV